MLYRSKTARVLWPVSCIATRSGARTAMRRVLGRIGRPFATTRDHTALRHVLASRYAGRPNRRRRNPQFRQVFGSQSLGGSPWCPRLELCCERRGTGGDMLVGLYSLGGLGSSMLIEIGHVEAIFRYPVKSMGGERLEVAKLGWHGLDGDRRLVLLC